MGFNLAFKGLELSKPPGTGV